MFSSVSRFARAFTPGRGGSGSGSGTTPTNGGSADNVNNNNNNRNQDQATEDEDAKYAAATAAVPVDAARTSTIKPAAFLKTPQSRNNPSSPLSSSSTAAASPAATSAELREFATSFWENMIDVELRQNIGKSVSCSICQSTLTDPVRTNCCHSFCKGCFNMLLRQMRKAARCTICQTPVDRRSIEDDTSAHAIAASYKETMKAFGMVPSRHTPSFTTLTQMAPSSSLEDDYDDFNGLGNHDDIEIRKHEDRLDALATATTWQLLALPNSKKAQKSHREENDVVVRTNLNAAFIAAAGVCDNGGRNVIFHDWEEYFSKHHQTSRRPCLLKDVAAASTHTDDGNSGEKKSKLDTTDHTTPRIHNTTLLHHTHENDDNDDNHTQMLSQASATVTPLVKPSRDSNGEFSNVEVASQDVEPSINEPQSRAHWQGTHQKDESVASELLPSTQEIQEQAREQLMADQEMTDAERKDDDEEEPEDKPRKEFTQSQGYRSAVSSLSQTQGTMETPRQEESQKYQIHKASSNDQDLSQPLLSPESDHNRHERMEIESTYMIDEHHKAKTDSSDDSMDFPLLNSKYEPSSSPPPMFARPSTGSSPCNRHTRKSFSKRDTYKKTLLDSTDKDSVFRTAQKERESCNVRTPRIAPCVDIAIRTTVTRTNSSRRNGTDESPNVPFETTMEMSPIEFMASQPPDEERQRISSIRTHGETLPAAKSVCKGSQSHCRGTKLSSPPRQEVTGIMEDSMGGIHMNHTSVLLEQQQLKQYADEETVFQEPSLEDRPSGQDRTDKDIVGRVEASSCCDFRSASRKKDSVSCEKKDSGKQPDSNDIAHDHPNDDSPTVAANQKNHGIPSEQEIIVNADADKMEVDENENFNDHDISVDSDETPKVMSGGKQDPAVNYDPRRASEVTSETHANTKKAVNEAATFPAGHAKSTSRPGKKKLFRQSITLKSSRAGRDEANEDEGHNIETSSTSATKSFFPANSNEVEMLESDPPTSQHRNSKSNSSNAGKGPHPESIIDIDTIVNVEPRTWPGINKLGGVARITKVNKDGTYNVSYVLGGKESNVDAIFIKKTEGEINEDDKVGKLSGGGSGRRRKRKSREPAVDDALPPDLLRQLAAEGYDIGGLSIPSSTQSNSEMKKDMTAKPPEALADSTNDRKRKTKSHSSQVNSGKPKRMPPTVNTVVRPASKEHANIEKQLLKSNTNDDADKNTKKAGKASESTISISNISDKEACKLADTRYSQRIEAALQSKVIHVASSNLSESDIDNLKELYALIQSVNDVAMKPTASIGRKTTLLVVPVENVTEEDGDVRARLRTLKAMKAALSGMPIVTPDWIDECKKEGKIVLPTSFVRSLPCKLDQFEKNGDIKFGVAKIAALWQLQPKKPAIFKNMHVHLCGTFPQEKRNTIVQLLKEGGAKILPTASDVPLMLTSSDARTNIVILCGDSGVILPKSVEREIMSAIGRQPFDERPNFSIVDSTWVFESISCAKPVEGSAFEPSGAKALWKFCQQK